MRLALTLLALSFIYSFKFTPMSQSIDIGAGQKMVQFQVDNESNEAMAVEFTVKERVMEETGKENLPDTQELAVFPPQVIIPPKEKRTVRVNWMGKEIPKTEKAYRVIAEQLPVKVDEKTKRRSGIQMLIRYMAALYVTPADVEPKIVVQSFSYKKDILLLTLQNEGTKHQILTEPVLNFKHDSGSWELKKSELKPLSGENVLAGARRTFEIKTTKKIPTDAKAKLSVDE